MVKKKKKQIHCICGTPADWYKKGKNHRVLVCSNCGIIANNPAPLVGLALSAGASLLKKKLSKTTETTQTIPKTAVFDSKDKPNIGERTINKVLYED